AYSQTLRRPHASPGAPPIGFSEVSLRPLGHENSVADRHCGTDRGRDLDVDLERRDRGAAVELDANVVALDRHVPRDNREDLFLEHGDKIHLAGEGAFVRQQDLQPLARHGSGAAPAEYLEQPHATLRPNSLEKRPLLSLGTVISTVSPWSRLAASR